MLEFCAEYADYLRCCGKKSVEAALKDLKIIQKLTGLELVLSLHFKLLYNPSG